MAIKTIELENGEKRYKLYFLKQAFDKMRLYVELCPEEIGWLGYVKELDNDAGYMVTDVFLLEQEVHATTTELSPTAIMNHYNSLDEEGREKFLNSCKLWGHSHVNMAPSPSGQDETQGKELSQDVDDYYIRLITNKRGEYNVTFYDKRIKAKVVTDEIILYSPEGAALRKAIQEEIDEKVKKKTYTTTTSSYKSATSNALSAYNNGYSSTVKKTTSKKLEVSKMNITDVFKANNYKSKFFNSLA